MAKVLVITGMHRSGTSMVAHYLQGCGVDIGTHLHPGDVGNPRGYYEDIEFLNFHQDLLAFLRVSIFPTTDRELRQAIPDQFRSRAQEILRRKGGAPVWGWKECRTTLFLDFWKEMIPDMNVLFLLRHPVSVVDSLLRRGTDQNVLRRPSIAFQSWRLHNELILDFYRRNPSSCFLIDVNCLVQDAALAVSALFSKLSIELPVRDFDAVYAPGAFREHRSARDIYLIVRFPLETMRCLTLYRAMREQADSPSTGVFSPN